MQLFKNPKEFYLLYEFNAKHLKTNESDESSLLTLALSSQHTLASCFQEDYKYEIHLLRLQV